MNLPYLAFSEVLPAWGTAAAVAGACWGWGRACVGRLLRDRLPAAAPFEIVPYLLWPATVGYGLATLLLALAGIFGLLGFSAGVAVTVVGGLLAVRGLLRDRRAWRDRPHPISSSDLPAERWVYRLGLLAAFGSAALAVLLPTTSLDALTYQLELPRRMLAAGSLPGLPYLEESYYPAAGSLGFAWGLSLGGLLGAQAVGGLWTAGLAAAAYETIRLRGTPRQARWGLLLTACVPAVHAQALAPLLDAAVACCAVLAWVAWHRAASSNDSPAWSVTAGVLLGTALAIKHTAILPAILLIAFTLVIPVMRRFRPRPAPGRPLLPSPFSRNTALAVAATLLFAGPWYVRTALLTGNPCWPYLADLLGGPPAAPVMRDAKRPLGRDPLGIVQAPFRLTFQPDLFGGRGHQLGPVFLFAACLVPWLRPRRRMVYLLAWVGGYLLLWCMTRQNLRFFLPTVPWPAAIAVLVLTRLLAPARAAGRPAAPVRTLRLTRGGPPARAAACLLLLAAAAPLPLLVLRAGPAVSRLAAGETVEESLRRREPTYPLAEACRDRLPPQAVLLSQELRAFHLPATVVRETIFRRKTGLGETAPTRAPADYFKALQAAGITHLLLARTDPPDPTAYDPFLAEQVARGRALGLSFPPVVSFDTVDLQPPRRYRLLALPVAIDPRGNP